MTIDNTRDSADDRVSSERINAILNAAVPPEITIPELGSILTELLASRTSGCGGVVKALKAAPQMLAALEAERAADLADDVFREMCERADCEGWSNDPTGSMHIHGASNRAADLRSEARALRNHVLAKFEVQP